MTRTRGRGNGADVFSWLLAVCVLLCCTGIARVAQTEPVTKMFCINAHESGNWYMKRGELLAAKEELKACAQDGCPRLVKGECAELLEQVSTAIPSIVIRAEDSEGNNVADVSVTMNGKPLAIPLDGAPVPLDPGTYSLRFERTGFPPLYEDVKLAEGQKNRAVIVRFPAKATASAPATSATPQPPVEQLDPSTPDAPQPDTPQPDPSQQEASSGVSPLVYVGFLVAGAGTLVGAITAGMSASQEAEAEEQCRENECTSEVRDDLDSAKTLGHVAAASFIVAGVGAVVGIVALLASGGDDAPKSTRRLQPIIGPGVVGVRGVF